MFIIELPLLLAEYDRWRSHGIVYYIFHMTIFILNNIFIRRAYNLYLGCSKSYKDSKPKLYT